MMAVYQLHVVSDVEVGQGGGTALHTCISLMYPKHNGMHSKVVCFGFFFNNEKCFSCLSESAPSQFFSPVEVDD